MSERDRKAYIAARIFMNGETNTGLPIRIADDEIAGCMWVFWTKKAARKTYGRNIELIEISVPDKQDNDKCQ